MVCLGLESETSGWKAQMLKCLPIKCLINYEKMCQRNYCGATSCALLEDVHPISFFFILIFSTFIVKSKKYSFKKLQMAGFEPAFSSFGINHSPSCATAPFRYLQITKC